MKKTIIALLSFFISVVSLSAQVDAKAIEILDKVTQELKKSAFTTVDFSLSIDNVQKKNSHKMLGTLRTHKDKMHVTTPFAEILYDGKFQYIYLKDANEITISEGNVAELQQFNPSYVLDSYKKNYRIPQPSIVIENNQQVYSIDLFPENRTETYFRINIKINVDKNEIISISTYEKSGTTSTIQLTKLVKNAPLAASDFQFDAKKFPRAEIIDLR